MMHILFHRHFDKEYVKLRAGEKKRFKERLALFAEDPFDHALGNHALAGKYQGYRSINVDGDLRAIYKSIAEDASLFVTIGTHSKLYGS